MFVSFKYFFQMYIIIVYIWGTIVTQVLGFLFLF